MSNQVAQAPDGGTGQIAHLNTAAVPSRERGNECVLTGGLAPDVLDLRNRQIDEDCCSALVP